MSITLATATTGDVGITRSLKLGEDNNGTFQEVDFTGLVSAIEAHVWLQGKRSAATTLSASFTAEATGTISVELGDAGGWLPTLTLPAHTDELDYLIEYQVTFANSDVETWGPDVLPIRKAGA